MAIKGKKKPRSRSPRVVTAGPRPSYVPPKVPLFQRTGAKFTVALIAEVILFSLIVGFGEQSETDREKAVVEEFSTLVDTALVRGGSAIQNLGGTAVVLPELGTRVTEVATEAAEAETVTEETTLWSDSLTDAAVGLAEIEVPHEGIEPAQVLTLQEARNFMERGLLLYASLAKQLGVAVQIEGTPRDDLVASIQSQIRTAVGVFDAGFGRLTDLRRQVGLPPPSAAPAGGVAPGLPGGLPGGIPAGSVPGGATEIEIPSEEPADGGGGDGGGNGGGGNG